MRDAAIQPFHPGDLVQVWGRVCTVTDVRWIDWADEPYWRVMSTWNGNLDAAAEIYTLIRRAMPWEKP